jgi:GNAT superfamily N-acetyltransferase
MNPALSAPNAIPWHPYRLVQPKDRPDYDDLVADVADLSWPAFMLHDPVADRYWGDLFERFADFQFSLLAPDQDVLVGMGNSVPLAWTGDLADLPGEGWDWAFAQAVADHAAGRAPTLQCALQIALPPASQGQGISRLMVQAMRQIGAAHGFRQLIAPVRPSHKSRYPLIAMDRYVTWTTDDGLPFDPWLRVHARLGAKIVKVCHKAMTITGSIGEWQAWTGLHFPESGPYVVPGALNPVTMDVEADRGVYIEPNVWMVHDLAERQ